MAKVNSKFWLLTYNFFKKDVKKPEDDLIILVHWLLLDNNFKVLGPGNENEMEDDEKPSEILPTNWSDDITYKFRYVRDKKLFLLNGVKAGDSFILNFYNVTTKHVSSAAFGDIDTVVQCINDMDKNKDSFRETVNMLQKDLINPMQKININKKVAQTQTATIKLPPRNPVDQHFADELLNLNRGPRVPISFGIPDLDPLAGLRNPEEGMIFDPLRIRNRRPFNPMFPPTARFDPIHPPNPDANIPGNLRRPNPDHMRPPQFDDNLYM